MPGGRASSKRGSTDGRLVVATYCQFLGSRFDKRGGSLGTYRGYKYEAETEIRLPLYTDSRRNICAKSESLLIFQRSLWIIEFAVTGIVDLAIGPARAGGA